MDKVVAIHIIKRRPKLNASNVVVDARRWIELMVHLRAAVGGRQAVLCSNQVPT